MEESLLRHASAVHISRLLQRPFQQFEVEEISMSPIVIENVVDDLLHRRRRRLPVAQSSPEPARHQPCAFILKIRNAYGLHVGTGEPQLAPLNKDTTEFSKQRHELRIQFKVLDHVLTDGRFKTSVRPGKGSSGKIDVPIRSGQVDVEPALDVSRTAAEVEPRRCWRTRAREPLPQSCLQPQQVMDQRGFCPLREHGSPSHGILQTHYFAACDT